MSNLLVTRYYLCPSSRPPRDQGRVKKSNLLWPSEESIAVEIHRTLLDIHHEQVENAKSRSLSWVHKAFDGNVLVHINETVKN